MKNKHIWIIIAGVVGLLIIIGLVVWTQQTSNYMTKPEFMDKFHVIEERWNGIIPVNLFYEALGHPANIKSTKVHGPDTYIFEYKIQNGVVELFVDDVGERLIAPSRYENCFKVGSLDDINKQIERTASTVYWTPEQMMPAWHGLTEQQYKERIEQLRVEQKLEKQKFEEYLKRKYGY